MWWFNPGSPRIFKKAGVQTLRLRNHFHRTWMTVSFLNGRFLPSWEAAMHMVSMVSRVSVQGGGLGTDPGNDDRSCRVEATSTRGHESSTWPHGIIRYCCQTLVTQTLHFTLPESFYRYTLVNIIYHPGSRFASPASSRSSLTLAHFFAAFGKLNGLPFTHYLQRLGALRTAYYVLPKYCHMPLCTTYIVPIYWLYTAYILSTYILPL